MQKKMLLAKNNIFMKYEISCNYTDPDRKHWIDDRWEFDSSEEFVDMLSTILDVSPFGAPVDTFEAYSEYMKRRGSVDDYIKDTWPKRLKAKKLYQDAIVAVSGTTDNPTPFKDEPYVIDVDSDVKVYVKAYEEAATKANPEN